MLASRASPARLSFFLAPASTRKERRASRVSRLARACASSSTSGDFEKITGDQPRGTLRCSPSAPTSTRASFDPAASRSSAPARARAGVPPRTSSTAGDTPPSTRCATRTFPPTSRHPPATNAPCRTPRTARGARVHRISRSEPALVRRWEVGYETREMDDGPREPRFSGGSRPRPRLRHQTIRATSPIRPALSRVRREDLRRRGGDARAAGVPRHVSRAPPAPSRTTSAEARISTRAVVTVPFAVRETMNANRASPSGAFPVPDRADASLALQFSTSAWIQIIDALSSVRLPLSSTHSLRPSLPIIEDYPPSPPSLSLPSPSLFSRRSLRSVYCVSRTFAVIGLSPMAHFVLGPVLPPSAPSLLAVTLGT